MAIPEHQLAPDLPIQEIPQEPEVPPQVEQATGVKAVPTVPQPMQTPQGQVVAQPVPAPLSKKPTITIPAQSQANLQQMAKGNASNSQTWFGVFWLRKIKKALQEGFEIIFGK